ncbi:lipocalin family protein [Pandoraea commovens]|uniref:Outer membrane lipoprotein Blc n=1 Tax=Pandoraea commovens TaxID=2508289 RepID=A0A5E4RGD1_9BURK|nr:lipocalin family protein [Pandoraea commovens]UVA81879.1 lipocalin family protein [Pandoraea commovens]VVD62235.1 lipocalin [Pandoraea commovens]
MRNLAGTRPSLRIPLLGLLSFALILLSACASTKPPPGVVPVSPFDIGRYEGRWYELARLDHSFERGMTDVSATYTPAQDGSVKVQNRGFDPVSGRWKEAIGKARFTGAPTIASLKVSFFGPFYGGYHVAALDPDYRWALVLGPDTGYCWILAREKHIDDAQMKQIVARAKTLGVDTESLIWVSHSRVDPTQ